MDRALEVTWRWVQVHPAPSAAALIVLVLALCTWAVRSSAAAGRN